MCKFWMTISYTDKIGFFFFSFFLKTIRSSLPHDLLVPILVWSSASPVPRTQESGSCINVTHSLPWYLLPKLVTVHACRWASSHWEHQSTVENPTWIQLRPTLVCFLLLLLEPDNYKKKITRVYLAYGSGSWELWSASVEGFLLLLTMVEGIMW